MVDIFRNDSGSLSVTEVKSVLKRKFLRIRLGKREYCFRILQVKDVVNGDRCTLEVKKEFKDYENIYGFLFYEDEYIPVFDLKYSYAVDGEIVSENNSVVIMDVLSDGFILQLGVIVNQIHDIIHVAMSEMSENLFFRN